MSELPLSGEYRHQSTYVLMKRLLSESVRPYAGTIALAVFFMVIVAAATAASAWLMEPIIDEVFVAKDRDALVWVAGAVLATFVIKGIANYLQVTLISRVGLKIIADKQNQLYAHLSRMDLGFFHDNPTGTLISRFTVDIGMMRAVVSNALTSLGKDLFSLIFLVGLMFYQNWELAFISIFVFPLAILPIVRLGRRIRKVTVNTQIETGLFMTLLEQTFQGIRVVK
ncbi:MAG: ABC transporter permease, partial [Rhodospirillaceae bacterium]|nr:ABC transporter permease [Rhodospirillaceae bacterium]